MLASRSPLSAPRHPRSAHAHEDRGECPQSARPALQPSHGLPYGLARAHRAILVSSRAAVCLDTRPISGDTNEIGAMSGLIDELHEIYGRTELFDTVIADAGNTSLAVAGKLADHNYGYILALKENHGEIHLEAERTLGRATARLELATQERGAT